MSLSRSLKKKLFLAFFLIYIASILCVGITYTVVMRNEARNQLMESSKSMIQKIILDFRRDFLISTRYIASAIDREEERMSQRYFQKIAETYGADEMTLVSEDGTLIFSYGEKTYGADFNAKFDETFRPVLKELFAANEATSEINKIDGLRLICAGRMSHGRTIFIAYPSERVSYLFLSHLTNFAYTIPIRKTGYVLIFDENETIISDMRGGGGFGMTAEKIGFKKTSGISKLQPGKLYSDKIHGKSSHFELERFDGYTVMSVLPSEDILKNAAQMTLAFAVFALVSLSLLFFFVIVIMEKYVTNALFELEDTLSVQEKSEFEDEGTENDNIEDVLKNIFEDLHEGIQADDESENGEPQEQKPSYDIMELSAKIADETMNMLENKDVGFILQIDPNTSSRFFGNGGDVESILRCLCQNAAQFTQKGLVALRIENRHELSFSVVDTGDGIQKDTLARLRLPFSELSEKEQDSSFARAREKIKNLGGSFNIKSAPQKGSVFSFSLPQEEASAQTCAECRTELFKNSHFDPKRTNLKNIPGAKLRSILTD